MNDNTPVADTESFTVAEGGTQSVVVNASVENHDIIREMIEGLDSEEIAAVAREWGAEVPFMRPAHLASDEARPRVVALLYLMLLLGVDILLFGVMQLVLGWQLRRSLQPS